MRQPGRITVAPHTLRSEFVGEQVLRRIRKGRWKVAVGNSRILSTVSMLATMGDSTSGASEEQQTMRSVVDLYCLPDRVIQTPFVGGRVEMRTMALIYAANAAKATGRGAVRENGLRQADRADQAAQSILGKDAWANGRRRPCCWTKIPRMKDNDD